MASEVVGRPPSMKNINLLPSSIEQHTRRDRLCRIHMQHHDKKQARRRSLGRQISRMKCRLERLAAVSDLYSRSQTAIVLFGAVATYIVFKFGGDAPGWAVL